MADIEWAEVLDSQQYVTRDMIEDAANVIKDHYVTCRAIFTGLICCICGERCETMDQWRRHVAEIILIRHTAMLKRKTMQDNPNVNQYGRNITSVAQDYTKRVSRWQ